MSFYENFVLEKVVIIIEGLWYINNSEKIIFFPFFSDSRINHKVHALVVDELTIF